MLHSPCLKLLDRFARDLDQGLRVSSVTCAQKLSQQCQRLCYSALAKRFFGGNFDRYQDFVHYERECVQLIPRSRGQWALPSTGSAPVTCCVSDQKEHTVRMWTTAIWTLPIQYLRASEGPDIDLFETPQMLHIHTGQWLYLCTVYQYNWQMHPSSHH